MSVRPITLNPDGSCEAYFDEEQHQGTLPAAQITWGVNMDQTPNHKTLAMPCPDGCGATSWHPAGGGAAPTEVQELFVDKATREGCACGEIAAGRTDAAPKAHIRLLVARMDGPERWKLGPVDTTVFTIVHRVSDGFVLGLDPDGPLDADLATLESDDALMFRTLMRTESAYVVDGAVRSAPA